ncbi:IS3 family transposase [Shuttleworthella satelles]|nr:IS3 family transposase [Shuttleworthia satelles]
MSRRKYTKEFKLKVLKEHEEQGVSFWRLGKTYGIEASIIRRWWHVFDAWGEEGFWGIMKREMYYGRKFRTKEELLKAIEKYMTYYTGKRVQRKLKVMTPMEYHEIKLLGTA